MLSWRRASWRKASWFAAGGCAYVAAMFLLQSMLSGHLLFNVTRSIPIGAYWISPDANPRRGDLVAAVMPKSVAELLHGRGFVPPTVNLLSKPILAEAGDHVCVWGLALYVNGEHKRSILDREPNGLPLPVSPICRELAADELFLATDHIYGVDSVHFGPVSSNNVRGKLTPLLTVDLPPRYDHWSE